MPTKNSILIAEDNPIIRDALILQVRRLGYDAEWAVDGQQAFDRFCSGEYRLVLLDVHMPRCSGTEAAILMRDHEQSNHLPRTPIVAVTALPETRAECYAAGMDDFIIKPLLFERMKQLIERWMPVVENVS